MALFLVCVIFNMIIIMIDIANNLLQLISRPQISIIRSLLSLIVYFLKVYETLGKKYKAQLGNSTSDASIHEQLHYNHKIIQYLV